MKFGSTQETPAWLIMACNYSTFKVSTPNLYHKVMESKEVWIAKRAYTSRSISDELRRTLGKGDLPREHGQGVRTGRSRTQCIAKAGTIPVKQVVIQTWTGNDTVFSHCPILQLKVFLAVIPHQFTFTVFIRRRSRLGCCNKKPKNSVAQSRQKFTSLSYNSLEQHRPTEIQFKWHI